MLELYEIWQVEGKQRSDPVGAIGVTVLELYEIWQVDGKRRSDPDLCQMP